MLSSGNPVAWDIERGVRSRELIAVLHKRGHDTEHWAVRIDRASHRISHISAGPILRTYDFQPEAWPCDLKREIMRLGAQHGSPSIGTTCALVTQSFITHSLLATSADLLP